MLPPVVLCHGLAHDQPGRALTCAFAYAAGPDGGGAEPQQDAVVEAYDECDPWAPLDMHDPGPLLVRPFRKVNSVQAHLCTA